MNKALEFLKECKVFYIATMEGDQPRVRPFGAIAELNGRIYTATNNKKDVFKQIMANPKIEISGMVPDGRWIRIAAEAYADADRNVKAEMLESNPGLKRMYSLDDGIFEVVYFKNAKATISSFGGAPEVFEF